MRHTLTLLPFLVSYVIALRAMTTLITGAGGGTGLLRAVVCPMLTSLGIHLENKSFSISIFGVEMMGTNTFSHDQGGVINVGVNKP